METNFTQGGWSALCRLRLSDYNNNTILRKGIPLTLGRADRLDNQMSSPYLRSRIVFILTWSAIVRDSHPSPDPFNHVSDLVWVKLVWCLKKKKESVKILGHTYQEATNRIQIVFTGFWSTNKLRITWFTNNDALQYFSISLVHIDYIGRKVRGDVHDLDNRNRWVFD